MKERSMKRGYGINFLFTPKDMGGPGKEGEAGRGRQAVFEGSAAKRVLLGLTRHPPLRFTVVVDGGGRGLSWAASILVPCPPSDMPSRSLPLPPRTGP
jgi:hypothetical protein